VLAMPLTTITTTWGAGMHFPAETNQDRNKQMALELQAALQDVWMQQMASIAVGASSGIL